jgi:hypothetical protein
VTGTAWEHQREVREALQAIVSGARSGTAVSRTPEEGADREALARTLWHPSASPATVPMDDSIL